MLLAGGASFEVWGLAVVGEQVGGIGAGPLGTVRPVGLLGAAADVEGDLAVGELGDLGDEQRFDGPARPASDGACRRLVRPAAQDLADHGLLLAWPGAAGARGRGSQCRRDRVEGRLLTLAPTEAL